MFPPTNEVVGKLCFQSCLFVYGGERERCVTCRHYLCAFDLTLQGPLPSPRWPLSDMGPHYTGLNPRTWDLTMTPDTDMWWLLNQLPLKQTRGMHSTGLRSCICICNVSAGTRYLNTVLDMDMPPNQYWYCSIVSFSMGSGALCSTMFIVFMTFERFYSIIRPHKAA